MPTYPGHPPALPSHQRRHEIARLLATALLRLLAQPRTPAPENPPETSPNCLEVVPDPRLTVHSR